MNKAPKRLKKIGRKKLPREMRICKYCGDVFLAIVGRKGTCCGQHKERIPREKRTCIRPGCGNTFIRSITNTQRFCSRRCASMSRKKSAEEKAKISAAHKGKKQSPEHKRNRLASFNETIRNRNNNNLGVTK